MAAEDGSAVSIQTPESEDLVLARSHTDVPVILASDSGSALLTVKKPAGKVTNNALPPGTRTRFTEVLVPRLLERLGRQNNPWTFQSNSEAATEVAHLWDEVFPNVKLNYTFNVEAPVFKLVRPH